MPSTNTDTKNNPEPYTELQSFAHAINDTVLKAERAKVAFIREAILKEYFSEAKLYATLDEYCPNLARGIKKEIIDLIIKLGDRLTPEDRNKFMQINTVGNKRPTVRNLVQEFRLVTGNTNTRTSRSEAERWNTHVIRLLRSAVRNPVLLHCKTKEQASVEWAENLAAKLWDQAESEEVANELIKKRREESRKQYFQDQDEENS